MVRYVTLDSTVKQKTFIVAVFQEMSKFRLQFESTQSVPSSFCSVKNKNVFAVLWFFIA